MSDNKNPSAVAGILAQGEALEKDEQSIGKTWPIGAMRRITTEHFGLQSQATRRQQQQPTAYCATKQHQASVGHSKQQ